MAGAVLYTSEGEMAVTSAAEGAAMELSITTRQHSNAPLSFFHFISS